jgi:transposase-like protein
MSRPSASRSPAHGGACTRAVNQGRQVIDVLVSEHWLTAADWRFITRVLTNGRPTPVKMTTDNFR